MMTMSKATEEKTVSQNDAVEVREKRYFSEEMRKHIVKEIEDKIYTVAECTRVYKVSQVSVYRWQRKYSLFYIKQITKVVELESESFKRKALEKQLADTQKLAGEQAVELAFFRKLTDIIEATYGMDLKKNIKTMSFDGLEKIRNTEKPKA